MNRLYRLAPLSGALLAVGLGAMSLSAATYYVAVDGSDSGDGTQQTPWRTIGHAADQVRAGDIVSVQEGTYAEVVRPGVNGTDVNNMVTFVAAGPVVMRGWVFDNSAHIRVVGFTMDTTAGGHAQLSGCVQIVGTCRNLEFWHNTMRRAYYDGIRCSTAARMDNCLVIGNTLHDFGIGNGSGMAIRLRGNDNLIFYNEISDSHPDGMMMFGDRNRWAGNYVHGLSEASGGHADVYQTGSGYNPDGWEQNLIETTFYVAAGSQGDEHVAQISYGQGAIEQAFTQNIFRRNVWHNVSQGTIGINQTDSGPITHTYIYNNTTAEACESSPSTRYGYVIYGQQTSDTFLFNNLEYESWGNNASERLEVYYVTGAQTSDYNLAYDPDGPVTFSTPFSAQAHPRGNVDPGFIDYASDDFRLGDTSGAINAGGPLTTVASASGSGTTFAVDNAGFFRGDNPEVSQYEGALVDGDTITVATNVAVISSISGNNITVTASLSWNQGDAVYYGNKATPDIGAFPAGHVPLTSAAIERDGSAYTVIPDGDTRWVVFFHNGVPHTVDSTAPYTATIASGIVDARAYPLYASKIPHVMASWGPPPSAPSRLRVFP